MDDFGGRSPTYDDEEEDEDRLPGTLIKEYKCDPIHVSI
jgi:hypothetical protein